MNKFPYWDKDDLFSMLCQAIAVGFTMAIGVISLVGTIGIVIFLGYAIGFFK